MSSLEMPKSSEPVGCHPNGTHILGVAPEPGTGEGGGGIIHMCQLVASLTVLGVSGASACVRVGILSPEACTLREGPQGSAAFLIQRLSFPTPEKEGKKVLPAGHHKPSHRRPPLAEQRLREKPEEQRTSGGGRANSALCPPDSPLGRKQPLPAGESFLHSFISHDVSGPRSTCKI